MKILSSMTTTATLIIILLIINLCATLTSIYLNRHEPLIANTAILEQAESLVANTATIEKSGSKTLEIIAENTLPTQPPKATPKATPEATPEAKPEADSTPKAPPSPPFHGLILRAAQQHALDPALIRAVIMAESSCNPDAVSNRGAEGLMQLMPRTAAELGVENSFDPEQNINGGAKYLRKLMDRFNNDVQLALAAYNAGSRYVRKYNGVPPFRATRLYIKKVFKYRTLYQQKPTNDNQMV